MNNDRNDEPFLSRWSRQKRAENKSVAPEETNSAEAPTVDLSKLPNIDELTADSDIAAFMQKGIPEALQQLALRRMWSLDPGIRDFVEVAENQWDFNAAGGIYGLFQEVAPGADMSVWLAQATSSVLPPETLTDPAREDAAAVHSESQLRVSSIETVGQSTEVASPALVEPGVSAEIAPTPIDPSERAEPEKSAKPIRRRHGGALPV